MNKESKPIQLLNLAQNLYSELTNDFDKSNFMSNFSKEHNQDYLNVLHTIEILKYVAKYMEEIGIHKK